MQDDTVPLRDRIEAATYAPQTQVLEGLLEATGLDGEDRRRIEAAAVRLVQAIRAGERPGLMEVFLAEYGLSTNEGIALMCLAEALLRVPDIETMDALIEDKIAPSDWGRHLGRSASPMVNASTWALLVSGRVLERRDPGLIATLKGAVKRLGEPVIRSAVARAMREMGRQFVLGESIEAALERARDLEALGYTHSYDMLGEAARCEADAERYYQAYSHAIARIGLAATRNDVRSNPGISIKLSALHPRYEVAQRDRVMAELAPRLLELALKARSMGMGLNIDAEEADRLVLSLDVIAAVLADPRLAGWDGFGVVVQAYSPRAGLVIDALYALAERHDRRLMIRLVKGAYWDSEIKRAQEAGVEGFPVFTRKAATDVSYIANARKLLRMTDRIYPQFATHNAHTVAAILDMAPGDIDSFEFQRLHGMGEALHRIVMEKGLGTRCRIYAPVGAHRELLAYLVRRLLENGANSSFVNRIVDETVPPEAVATDPLSELEAQLDAEAPAGLRPGPALFEPDRRNSRGWDLAHGPHLAQIETARAPGRSAHFNAAPRLAGPVRAETAAPRHSPSDPTDLVGWVQEASARDVATALAHARPWNIPERRCAEVLRQAADLYEAHAGEIFALLAREAGKTLPDAVGELREAVDFLRYYAARIDGLAAPARGLFVCISPWNFPLAIFTGQIAAALAAGNAVIAKPAEQTPLIAHLATGLLHEAGVPPECLQLLPGDGRIGAQLTSDRRVTGVAFTGSTETARLIQRAMATHMAPGTPLIAETGGLNAMIVDSTALPEQAVRDVIASAFQSAGQRCSALRCLYVQEDIAPGFLAMLQGAMAELNPGAPWELSSDLGPLIDAETQAAIASHVATARAEGRVIWEGSAPREGHFQAPVAIRVPGIEAIEREIFGPVLHVATFAGGELDRVVEAVNATGYGLTFGLHSRIDDRVERIAGRLAVGNVYVNRNQIGAVVGSQPFGGEGLSGTGPKAGGPHYLPRFTERPAPEAHVSTDPAGVAPAAPETIAAAVRMAQPARGPETLDLPGPTGEANRLTTLARPPLLCLGPGPGASAAQAEAVRAQGGAAVTVEGLLEPAALRDIEGIAGALWWGDAEAGRAYALALAERDGPILPLIAGMPDPAHVRLERHLCIDTTAAGGNAALLAEAGSA
ncbi:bifunctional proline dehydrogenase/L-glutamate gamma-semialdehyde dehydrogenase [Rhodovulum sulfidophilum]|uniref:bifunctional proline dehydrogenase/L-glutamate gamma-semialdehyde dehydrogenase PutA n=1 Tax=Rhodovulum sulfidophilum TaxID=35806 RepID=UPI00191172FA|nr:bifunctional proline dehydrogenase/L-glutamate gamma-semialdehyde dehydrogenase PutA [Rhodovulum sulfidophilum]MBK5923244.1 bifunctional proline dehydrogenase/L-glutamate gamma-semialdehyde dehydrogenase [Rhodovulum sulfidophilum]